MGSPRYCKEGGAGSEEGHIAQYGGLKHLKEQGRLYGVGDACPCKWGSEVIDWLPSDLALEPFRAS